MRTKQQIMKLWKKAYMKNISGLPNVWSQAEMSAYCKVLEMSDLQIKKELDIL